jgi:hypothetical protein
MILKLFSKLDMVIQMHTPRTMEPEAGGLWVWGQPVLHREILYEKKWFCFQKTYMLSDKMIFAYYWALRDDIWDVLVSPIKGFACSYFLSSSPKSFISLNKVYLAFPPSFFWDHLPSYTQCLHFGCSHSLLGVLSLPWELDVKIVDSGSQGKRNQFFQYANCSGG